MGRKATVVNILAISIYIIGLPHLHGGARSHAQPDTVRDYYCGCFDVRERQTQTKHPTVYAGSRLKPPLLGKVLSYMPAFQPYRGNPAVRNDREGRGNVGIIRSPIRASTLPDGGGRVMKRTSLPLQRREFITLLGGAAAWPLAVRAQWRGPMPICVAILTRNGERVAWNSAVLNGRAAPGAHSEDHGRRQEATSITDNPAKCPKRSICLLLRL